MELQTALAIGSLITVGILCWNRYWSIFPWFLVTAGLFTVQALINAFLPYTSHLNRYIWTPSELLLMASILISLGEALWKNTESMNRLPRFWMVFGMIAFSVGLIGLLRSGYSYASLDWYHRLWLEREWLYMLYATVGFCGFWFSVFTPNTNRLAAEHLGLYTGFLAAIRFIPDPKNYYASHQTLIMVELLALALWCVNSYHLNFWLKLIAKSDPLFSKLRFSFHPEKRVVHVQGD